MVDPSFTRRSALKRRAAPQGEGISPRQEQILSALKSGMTERQAAEKLGLSAHSVHSHVQAAYRRMGVKSRAQLLSLWTAGEK